VSSDLSWREHVKIFYPQHIKLSTLLDIIQHWSQSSNQEDSPSHSQRSQIWCPHLLKNVQHHATKYILNDFTSDYRSRLIALKILPLMMQLELYDVMFSLEVWRGQQMPSTYMIMSPSILALHVLLKHVLSRTNSARHFYFNRMPRLWNSLPTIDLDQSTGSIKLRVQRFLWDHFICSFKCDW